MGRKTQTFSIIYLLVTNGQHYRVLYWNQWKLYPFGIKLNNVIIENRQSFYIEHPLQKLCRTVDKTIVYDNGYFLYLLILKVVVTKRVSVSD